MCLRFVPLPRSDEEESSEVALRRPATAYRRNPPLIRSWPGVFGRIQGQNRRCANRSSTGLVAGWEDAHRPAPRAAQTRRKPQRSRHRRQRMGRGRPEGERRDRLAVRRVGRSRLMCPGSQADCRLHLEDGSSLGLQRQRWTSQAPRGASSSIASRIRSRIETMPTGLSPWSTGRWRKPPWSMIAAACPGRSSGPIVSGS